MIIIIIITDDDDGELVSKLVVYLYGVSVERCTKIVSCFLIRFSPFFNLALEDQINQKKKQKLSWSQVSYDLSRISVFFKLKIEASAGLLTVGIFVPSLNVFKCKRKLFSYV